MDGRETCSCIWSWPEPGALARSFDPPTPQPRRKFLLRGTNLSKRPSTCARPARESRTPGSRSSFRLLFRATFSRPKKWRPNGVRVGSGRGDIGIAGPLPGCHCARPRVGARLEKGQIVLAGSFTRPVSVAPGDVIHADYGSLGAIGVSFPKRSGRPDAGSHLFESGLTAP